MNCPNCGLAVADNANFCQNCGFRFDEVRRVEPIRVVINPAETEPPNIVQPVQTVSPPQPVIIREKSATGAIVALTAMLVLLVLGVAGLFVYYLLTRQPEREIAVANANSANTVVAAVPSPTTYEDLKNKLAPPDKRVSLVDEQFEVTNIASRSIELAVTNPKGARLVGGFRVIKGKPVNFYIQRADVDGESPASERKPLQESQTRNKILNQRLPPGDYFLIFANDDEQPVTVAAELFLVYD